jgi:O-antigen/teichoic acid export membrane protein
MILPFMRIYTSSFSNDNFIQPLFAGVILAGELVYCLRLPYETIITAAGRFQDTQRAAFIEAGLNLALSIILIRFLGITGVVMGTLVSIVYRLIFFTGFLHRNILNLKYSEIIKRMAVSSINIFLIAGAMWKWAQAIMIHSFIEWTAVAAVVTSCASAITLVIHILFYKEELWYCMSIFYGIVRKKTL